MWDDVEPRARRTRRTTQQLSRASARVRRGRVGSDLEVASRAQPATAQPIGYGRAGPRRAAPGRAESLLKAREIRVLSPAVAAHFQYYQQSKDQPRSLPCTLRLTLLPVRWTQRGSRTCAPLIFSFYFNNLASQSFDKYFQPHEVCVRAKIVSSWQFALSLTDRPLKHTWDSVAKFFKNVIFILGD